MSKVESNFTSKERIQDEKQNRKRSIFHKNKRVEEPQYPIKRNLSPLKSKLNDGESVNGSFPGGEDSYVSNPSIMETDGNKTKKISSPKIYHKQDLRLSSFSNRQKSNIAIKKYTTDRIVHHNSNTVIPDNQVQKSMTKTEDQSNFSNYQSYSKYGRMGKTDSMNSLDLNQGQSPQLSNSNLHKPRTRNNTRISIFGRGSPTANKKRENEVKLRPLFLNKVRHPDTSSENLSESYGSSNKREQGEVFLGKYEKTASLSSVSSKTTENNSDEEYRDKNGKKLMRFKPKKDLSKPKKKRRSIEKRTSYFLGRNPKASRLDITMNNLDIQYVGEYQLFRCIGKGSFAKVFKAKKKGIQKTFVKFYF